MNVFSRASNGIIPTTPEPPCLDPPNSPSASGSPGESRPPPSIDASNQQQWEQVSSTTAADSTPRQPPNQNARNATPIAQIASTSATTRGTRSGSRTPGDEANGNQQTNGRTDRSLNGSQARRPSRTNRNRNSGAIRTEAQPLDLPRGYGE